MSELPRTEESYDAARVEEAFATFSERVQELESVAGELREELRALRSERLEQERLEQHVRRRRAEEAWPVEPSEEPVGRDLAPAWIGSVPAPVSRAVAVPRFALEAIFLVLVAVFAGLADLTTTVIVIVMATALALVVVSEVATAAKRARWRLDAVAGSAAVAGPAAGESTDPWSVPVVEATVVEAPADSESHTVVTKLPPELDAEPEPVAEPEIEPQPEIELEPEPEPEPEIASGFEIEAEPKPALAAEPESELPPEAEAGQEAIAETETEQSDGTEPDGSKHDGDKPGDEPPSIPPAEPDLQPDPGSAPKRGFGLFRRKRGVDEPSGETPDPWEI